MRAGEARPSGAPAIVDSVDAGRAEPLLRVRDLRVRFGAAEAVRGISFDVPAGETLGLVGESGSGKSATSLAIMRLLPRNATVEGQIMLRGAAVPEPAARRRWWAGGAFGASRASEGSPAAAKGGLTSPAAAVNLLQLPEEAMRGQRGRAVAMVFQEPMTALNPVMTIERQVGEAVLAHAPRTGRAELRARVVQALREVALPDPERRLRDYPHQFSGGQRQRIVIATALMNRPKLLIADEPTTALDVTVQAQIVELLRRLRAELGLSMLFISHDLPVVGQVADRIAVMRHGQIVEQGPAREVLTRPQHPYTQALLAAAPTMHTPRDQPLRTGAGS